MKLGQLLLITVAGPDTPGITAALTGLIAKNDVALRDIEQVVVQGQLTLCLLLEFSEGNRDEAVLKDLLFTAKSMGLDLQFRPLSSSETEFHPGKRVVVTAIGNLGASGLSCIADALLASGANIAAIQQLSFENPQSIEIVAVSNAEGQALRKALIQATEGRGIDIAVQPETLLRHTKRLVVMDMDSTLIQVEVIDELARMHGVLDRVASITKRAMEGALDFTESLTERVALLKGLEFTKARALAEKLPLSDGAEALVTALRSLGFKTGVISGGFVFGAEALKARLGLDYAYANQLEVKDGIITGRVLGAVVDAQRKAELLETIAQAEGISLGQTIAIGDGANDVPMLARAGLGIAFHGKPTLRDAADTSLSGGLDRLLFLLGLRSRDIKSLVE